VFRTGQHFDRFKLDKQLPGTSRHSPEQIDASPARTRCAADTPLADRVRIEQVVTLADNWSVLKKNTFS
jgi:hypothetical protein